MNEIFLLKLGEIILKGSNKRQFENKLRQNIRRRMKPYGNFDVYILNPRFTWSLRTRKRTLRVHGKPARASSA